MLEHALLHWRSRLRTKQQPVKDQKPLPLRKRRQNVKSEANWKLFYYKYDYNYISNFIQ
jgi:DnaJ family protein C protein 13